MKEIAIIAILTITLICFLIFGPKRLPSNKAEWRLYLEYSFPLVLFVVLGVLTCVVALIARAAL